MKNFFSTDASPAKGLRSPRTARSFATSGFAALGFATLGLAALALTTCLTGCLTDASPTTGAALDGSNVVLTQEVKNMALVLGGSATLPKLSSKDSTEDSVEVEDSSDHETLRSHLQFDTTCQCFVRSADFMNRRKDFGRTRVDSIWLFAAGVPIVDSFVPRQADSILHVRRITRTNTQTGDSTDFTVSTTLVKRATDSGTVYLWSGTITGILNGTALTGTTFSLVRPFSSDSGFGNPSGNMFIRRGPHDASLELHGDGTATCTIRRGEKVERTTHIDKNDNES